jgi:hypothetical protein
MTTGIVAIFPPGCFPLPEDCTDENIIRVQWDEECGIRVFQIDAVVRVPPLFKGLISVASETKHGPGYQVIRTHSGAFQMAAPQTVTRSWTKFPHRPWQETTPDSVLRTIQAGKELYDAPQ